MAVTREFELGDVLSAVTGHLLSRRGIEGVYDVAEFLTGAVLVTAELPAALRFCRTAVLAQYPHLAEVTPETGQDEQDLVAWPAGANNCGPRLTLTSAADEWALARA